MIKNSCVMVRINNYSIVRKGNLFEIYWENNEFCRYACTLMEAIFYVTEMLYCIGLHKFDFVHHPSNCNVNIVDHQLYLDF